MKYVIIFSQVKTRYVTFNYNHIFIEKKQRFFFLNGCLHEADHFSALLC